MQKAEKVSVIVPVYNTAIYLPRCIESIINQTYKNIEIIIVNDGSTDSSASIIQKYQLDDNRIIVLNKNNGGLSSARNFGIEHASGEYILHVDSDDWIESYMCEYLVNEASSNNADIVVCDVFFDLFSLTKVRKEPYHVQENKYSFLQEFIFHSGLNSICNKLIRKNLYDISGIRHYEDISLGEDSTTLLRLLLYANKIVHLFIPLYHYDLKTNGMSRGIKKNILEYYVGLRHVERYYLDCREDISIFPFIRLKILYTELARCSLRKAKNFGYTDYIKVARLFTCEVRGMIKSPHYCKLKLKYKIFIFMYRMYIYFLGKKLF